MLRIIGDLSAEDTAKALGKPITAVKSLKRRAIQRLEKKLGAA